MIENVQESASPLDGLDDLGRSVLAIEVKNPGVSSMGIVKELNLKIDRRTVDHRRRHPAYQAALSEMRRDNIMEVKSAQSRAIQRLAELLEHPDPSISLASARILAEPSLRGATKRAEVQVEDERVTKPVDNTVRVIFGEEGTLPPVFGETTMDDTGRIVPIANAQRSIESELHDTKSSEYGSTENEWEESGVIYEGMARTL